MRSGYQRPVGDGAGTNSSGTAAYVQLDEYDGPKGQRQMPVNSNMPEQLMTDPREDIAKFLADNGTVPERRLDVAMAFARSMSQELQMALSQWQAVERTLAQLKVAADN
jgi:hypothetical protein